MDNFAQIAKNGIQGRMELLEQPLPKPLPNHTISLDYTEGQPTAVPSKMHTRDELTAALQKKREQYAPFLKDYAPKQKSCREVLQLSEFCWKKKTDTEWKTVSIPHYGEPLGAATTVYETSFSIQVPAGKHIFLVINGADYKAQVYINGILVGTHEGFFASFEFEITSFLHEGENTLTITLQNDYVMMGSRSEENPATIFGDKIYAATGTGYDDPALGWHHCPPGMGLLDTVEIQTREPVFLQGIFARTLEDEIEFWIEAGSCVYELQTISFDLSVYGQNIKQTIIEHLHIIPSTGKELGLGDTFTEVLARREGTLHAQLPLPCGKGRNLYKVRISAADMRWWSPEEPWLYQVQLELRADDGRLLDTCSQQFGRRIFTQDTEAKVKGMFYLNHQPIRLRGANTMGFEQQDVMKGDIQQLIDDILLGKLCNMNFWRITQRPVQKTIYEYCDKLGLMVQTDLPLFGNVRRHQFCEVIRQAEEMERHIRAHTCCVLVSYINEPFPNANNLPSMNLERSELEQMFAAADIVVKLNNPDRVIKHVDGDYDPPSASLPDNHCYPMWYNGHGIDIGLLHKGGWMPVKPNWYYGCGEFGCEGLEDWELMQERYPADWLVRSNEAETDWDPVRIVRAQTAEFYHFFYDRPATPQEWVKESQAFQSIATHMMTEAFRRDDRMVTFAIHLFIDAFPSGWMKTIMDCRRVPKPAFFAYRNALEPILLSLRADKTCFFGGETAKVEGWICNDTNRSETIQIRYELLDGDHMIATAVQDAQLKPCGSYCHSVAEWKLPKVTERHTFQLRAILLDGETCVTWNQLEYTVFPPCEEPLPMRIRKIDTVTEEDLVAVSNGEVLWIDKPQAGDYIVGNFRIHVQESGMAPMHFASAKTMHPWVDGFCQEDFRHWYDSVQDRIAPLADCTISIDGFAPVLISRNITADGWQPAAILCEHSYGKGKVIASQISYAQMLENPAGKTLLSHIHI